MNTDEHEDTRHFSIRIPLKMFSKMEIKRKELKRSRTLFVQMAINNYLLYLESGKENYVQVAESQHKYLSPENDLRVQKLEKELEELKKIVLKKLDE